MLHLINNLRREGAQLVLFNMVTSQASRANHVVCAREAGGLESELHVRGVPVFLPDRYYGARGIRQSLAYLDHIVHRENIDLVHAHMADAAVLGAVAAARRHIPLVITHHGQDILPGCNGRLVCRAIYAVLLALAARYACRNVAVTPFVADSVKRRLLFRRKGIAVIPNGISIPADTSQPQIGRPLIVSVGRLVKLKGQEQLVSATASLSRSFEHLRVAIVGDGPLRETLVQKAKALGIEGSIAFTGAVDDVSTYLRSADVYVSTSQREGMPLAVLEAMAWRVPVVASDIPGNRSLICNGETGLLYQWGDIAGLTEAVRVVLEDPEHARERARRAYKLVQERCNIEATVRAYESLYVEVLSAFRSPRKAHKRNNTTDEKTNGAKSDEHYHG